MQAKRPGRDLNPRITDLQSLDSGAETDSQSVGASTVVPRKSVEGGAVFGADLSRADLRERIAAGERPNLRRAFARIHELVTLDDNATTGAEGASS